MPMLIKKRVFNINMMQRVYLKGSDWNFKRLLQNSTYLIQIGLTAEELS